MVGNFTIVRDAAEQFVGDLLPDDKARIGSFAEKIQIDPPQFTSDKNELIRVLRYNLQNGGPTPLWNATNVAMTALKHQDGRRVVLVFTDGYDSPDRPSWHMTLDDVISQSQSDEVMVYAIGLADSCGNSSPASAPISSPGPRYQRRPGGRGGRPPGGYPGRLPPPPVPGGGRYPIPGPDPGGWGGRIPGDVWNGRPYIACTGARPDPGLQMLADEAGGGYFELRRTDDLASTFARVADELHHQYLLGFTATAHDGKLHSLDVRLRDSSMSARARRSYLAPSADRPASDLPIAASAARR
jgi:VWFA-related protein